MQEKKNIYCKSGQTLAEVLESGFGDIQNPTGQCHEPPALSTGVGLTKP